MIRKVFLLMLFLSVVMLGNTVQAQETIKERKRKFDDAVNMSMEGFFSAAGKYWDDLLTYQPQNANWNFFAGSCMMKTPGKQQEAIKYLEKALDTPTVAMNNYDGALYQFRQAPHDVYFALAQAYHLDYQFDKAEEHFKKFQELAHRRNPNLEEVDRHLSMIKTAREMVQNPIDIDITNLGPNVNSSYEDYCPVPNLDETAIFFTTRRLRDDSSNFKRMERSTGKYFEDVYVSYKSPMGNWQKAEMLGMNTQEHEATSSLTADGEKLFIYKDKNGTGNLYESLNTDSGWTDLEAAGEHINSDAYESHVDVSADNQRLYFVSDREGGHGGKDIYQCRKLPDGSWSEPLNLGPTINTPFDEDGPFIHPDGKTLYFSSKGHNTMGGHDVFTSELMTGDKWTKPENVGYPINTTDDDVYFVTTPDGKRAYYSSDFRGMEGKFGSITNYGGKDIYLVEFPEAGEKKLTLLKGVIEGKQCKEVLSDVFITVIDKTDGGIVHQLVPRSRDGGYVCILPPGKEYLLSYAVKGEEVYSENIAVEKGSSYQEIRRGLNLDTLGLDCGGTPPSLASKEEEQAEEEKAGEDKTEKPAKPIASYKESFGYNKNAVNTDHDDFINMIDKAYNVIKERGTVFVEIEGSASKVPTETFGNNEKLAELRSEKAKGIFLKALKERSIDNPADKVEFEKVTSKVQGPAYARDPWNKSKYGKWQYTKMSVK